MKNKEPLSEIRIYGRAKDARIIFKFFFTRPQTECHAKGF